MRGADGSGVSVTDGVPSPPPPISVDPSGEVMPSGGLGEMLVPSGGLGEMLVPVCAWTEPQKRTAVATSARRVIIGSTSLSYWPCHSPPGPSSKRPATTPPAAWHCVCGYSFGRHSSENPEWAFHSGGDERLNENRYPLHSVLREIQQTDCGALADLTPLVVVAGQLKFQGRAQRQGPLRVLIV
jgi:hypothetical protein